MLTLFLPRPPFHQARFDRSKGPRNSLLTGIFIFAAILAGIPAWAQSARDATQLEALLAGVRGGETITLEAGNYGNLLIKTSFPDTVTIRSRTKQKAIFDMLRIEGKNIVFDGVTVAQRLTLQGAEHITVLNSRLSGFSEANFSGHVRFDGNDIGGIGTGHGLFIVSTHDFEITNNYVHEVESDLLRICGNAFNGLVENNILNDMVPKRFADGTYTHSDVLQMYSTKEGTPHQIIIRGNLIHDDPATGEFWGQGIFLGGPTGGYRDITIEQNLLSIGSPNAIFVADGAAGIDIRNNTLIPWPTGEGGSIRLIGYANGVNVVGNVTARILDETGEAKADDNFTYAVNASNPLFFKKMFPGDGARWQDYLPNPGTPIGPGSGYGALKRLAELGTQ